MALDPRISLAAQPPNIPQFDLLGAMLTSARLREAQTLEEQRRQQMQEMQAELVRQERQRALMRGWAEEDRGVAPGQGATYGPSILQRELGAPSPVQAPALRQTEFRPTVTSPITSEPGFTGTVRTGEDAAGVRTAEPARLPEQPLTQTTQPVAAPDREATPEERHAYEQVKRLRATDPELERQWQRMQFTVTPPPPAPGQQVAVAPTTATDAQPAAATAPPPAAQVTPLPGMRMQPRTATQRAYALLGNGASNALQVVQGLDAAENAEVNRQTARLQQGVTALDYIQRASSGVNSQASLDAVRASIESKAPGAGAVLPPTYEPTQWAQFQQGLKTQEQLHREALLEIQKGNLKVAETGAQTQQQQVAQQGRTVQATVADKAVDVARNMQPFVTDQRTLDMYVNAVRELSPQLAETLPKTYTKEAIDELGVRLKKTGARSTMDEGYGTLYYVYDEKTGKYTSYQLTKGGVMREPDIQLRKGQRLLPPGELPPAGAVIESAPSGTAPSSAQAPAQPPAAAQAQPPVTAQTPQGTVAVPPQGQGQANPPQIEIQPPVVWKDTGTQLVPLDKFGRQSGAAVPKQVEEAKRQEAKGTATGTYEGKLPEAARKYETLLNNLDQKQKLVSATIDEAIKQAENKDNWLPTTGVYGGLIKNVYQPGTDLANNLSTITGNTGIEELQAIRDASPTGAALGPVSDYENRMLQSLRGSLQQEQSKEQLIAKLTFMKKFMADAQKWRIETFERDLAKNIHAPRIPQVPPGATVAPPPAALPGLPGRQPQAAPAGTPQQQTKEVISLEQQRRVLQGKTPAEQEALKRAWRQQYRLEGE